MLKNKINWLLPVLLGILLFGAGCSTYEYTGTLLDPPMAIPDFELTDTNNQPFHLSDVKGNIALVYFGYPMAHEDDPQRAALADALPVLDRLVGGE